jgi:hypothetical protein
VVGVRRNQYVHLFSTYNLTNVSPKHGLIEPKRIVRIAPQTASNIWYSTYVVFRPAVVEPLLVKPKSFGKGAGQ